MINALSQQRARDVLIFLKVSPAAPTTALLDKLIAAYSHTVPWETASRIARRAERSATSDCPRWSEEFWTGAMQYGTGGTCFESNYAFFALLRSLGYDGYLTVNNMHDTIGCHTAIVIQLGQERRLLDVGYPLYAALPLDPERLTVHTTPFFTYTVQPTAPGHYVLERTPHPKPYLFTLIDRPIENTTYCQATTDDYGENGLFLDTLVIHKVVDEQIWRFNSAEQPYHLETFSDGIRVDHPISGDVATALSRHFGIARSIIDTAVNVLELDK